MPATYETMHWPFRCINWTSPAVPSPLHFATAYARNAIVEAEISHRFVSDFVGGVPWPDGAGVVDVAQDAALAGAGSAGTGDRGAAGRLLLASAVIGEKFHHENTNGRKRETINPGSGQAF